MSVTPIYSQNLQHTLRSARASAGERRQEYATSEYLLLALIDDADAAEVMRAFSVDFEKLRDRITQLLPAREVGVVIDSNDGPELDADVAALLQRAMRHVTSAARDVVTGADVLVQIFAGPTAHFLREQGMTSYDVKMHMSHGIAKATDVTQSDSTSSRGTETADRPSMFRVLLLNDDFTPMEFVVHVLEQIFHQDRETATRIMLHIHHHGTAECGVYPHAVAEAKAKELLDFSREHEHPLLCVVEAAPPG